MLGHSTGQIQGFKFKAPWRGLPLDSDTLRGHPALAGASGQEKQDAGLLGTWRCEWGQAWTSGTSHLIFSYFLQGSLGSNCRVGALG